LMVKALGAKVTVTTGFVLVAAGGAIGAATTVTSPMVLIGAWMAVLCAGTGLAISAAVSAALSQLSAERSGTGSAVVQVFQKTAGPLGTAIMGSVLAAAYQTRLDTVDLPPAVAAAARHSVFSGLAVANQLASPELAGAVRAAFVHGMDVSLLASAGIAVVGAILSVAFLPGPTSSARPHKSSARPHKSSARPHKSSARHHKSSARHYKPVEVAHALRR
jgi:MFS transporter, DHA2 family, multidrug resistance protein